MKRFGPVDFMYLIPYLAIIALGIWYRAQVTPVFYFDGDSANYLLPPMVKAMAHVWHKGERPMPYLQFIYLTLSKTHGLKYTVMAQQALNILGAVFLTGAWFVFLRGIKKYTWVWHLMGYVMLTIFVQSPTLLYYEQLIGPESPCIFVMCVLISCLTVALSAHVSNNTRRLFLGICIYVNLFLIVPMPKWVFAGAFMEVFLVYKALKFTSVTVQQRRRLLLVPHLAYLLLVYAPEKYYKIDQPYEDRTNIEFEQMAYTHFDLLTRDKSNFQVSPSMQDSLMQCFHEAQKAEPGFLIGFGSDYLMWGRASELVNSYYKNNYDSIGRFYRHLNYVLVTKYPLALTVSIIRQLGIYYLPTHYAHKNFCNYPNTQILYNGTKATLGSFDKSLAIKLQALSANMSDFDSYRLDTHYPAAMEQSGVCITEQLPFVLPNTFWFFRWFDHIFLFVMCSFFIMQYINGRLFTLNLVALLYVCIFIYACTIAIVHTFDVDRFIVTVLPFNLVTTFMAMAFVGRQWLDIALQLVTKLTTRLPAK